jgi:hypothetical protein
MMQRQPNRAVNIFSMAHVTCHSERSLRVPYAPARRLHSPRIARQHYHTRTTVGKNFGNRFADAHGSARDYHHFPYKLHTRFYASATCEVKRCATIRQPLIFRALSAPTEIAWPSSFPYFRSM